MSIYDFLKKVDLFAELSEEDLYKICGSVDEMVLPKGETLFEEGDRGDKAYIIKEGGLEIIKQAGDREMLLAVRGESAVIGELALLEEGPRSATVRARVPTTLIIIPKEMLDDLLDTSPSAARAMLRTVLERWRGTQAHLRQSEKMAQLGTLTAGIAHELNNPAAAVKRGADQMRFALAPLAETQANLRQHGFSAAQQAIVDELALQVQLCATEDSVFGALDRSNREEDLEDWLDESGIEEPWDLTPNLVDLDFTVEKAVELSSHFELSELEDILRWIVAMYQAHSLLREVGQGAARISEIVKALKSYSYLDQAPIQSVDIHQGLNNTLVILRHKLKQGIEVMRHYAPDLPHIEGYGSELNQVWTNILDNAIDALDGEGVITITTRQEGSHVVVEIEDNGPGVPKEIQSRIFDAFFTTKPPGKGTGLGLNISYNIVIDKHRGDIRLHSQPGSTCFQVWLPLNFEEAGPGASIDPASIDRIN
jgi:signal transduction histidine kinase